MISETKSLVEASDGGLDKAKLIALVNRAQAILLYLSTEKRVPENAQAQLRKANDEIIKAMRMVHSVNFK